MRETFYHTRAYDPLLTENRLACAFIELSRWIVESIEGVSFLIAIAQSRDKSRTTDVQAGRFVIDFTRIVLSRSPNSRFLRLEISWNISWLQNLFDILVTCYVKRFEISLMRFMMQEKYFYTVFYCIRFLNY